MLMLSCCNMDQESKLFFFAMIMSPWLSVLLLESVSGTNHAASGLGPYGKYTWGTENRSAIPGTDETRKVRCGWFRNDQSDAVAGNEMCAADWRPICEQIKSRLSDPQWQSHDVVTLDFFRDTCGALCHFHTTMEECSKHASGNTVCHWIYFDSIASGGTSGACVSRFLVSNTREFGLQQYRMGRDQELANSFIGQFHHFVNICSQLSLRNEQSCKQRGSPCVWRPHMKFSTTEAPCHVDELAVLENFSPELAEFFAPDTFCIHRSTESACLNAHIEKDLSLVSFIMLRKSIWPYYVTIIAMVLSILLMLKFCKMPPPPFVAQKRDSITPVEKVNKDVDVSAKDVIKT